MLIGRVYQANVIKSELHKSSSSLFKLFECILNASLAFSLCGRVELETVKLLRLEFWS